MRRKKLHDGPPAEGAPSSSGGPKKKAKFDVAGLLTNAGSIILAGVCIFGIYMATIGCLNAMRPTGFFDAANAATNSGSDQKSTEDILADLGIDPSILQGGNAAGGSGNGGGNAGGNTQGQSQAKPDGELSGTDGTPAGTVPGSSENPPAADLDNSDWPSWAVAKDGCDYIYEIKYGKTLSKISAEVLYCVDFLADYNSIRNVNLICAGSVLRVPDGKQCPFDGCH